MTRLITGVVLLALFAVSFSFFLQFAGFFNTIFSVAACLAILFIFYGVGHQLGIEMDVEGSSSNLLVGGVLGLLFAFSPLIFIESDFCRWQSEPIDRDTVRSSTFNEWADSGKTLQRETSIDSVSQTEECMQDVSGFMTKNQPILVWVRALIILASLFALLKLMISTLFAVMSKPYEVANISSGDKWTGKLDQEERDLETTVFATKKGTKVQKTFGQIGNKRWVEEEIVKLLENGATSEEISKHFDVSLQSATSKLAGMRARGLIPKP